MQTAYGKERFLYIRVWHPHTQRLSDQKSSPAQFQLHTLPPEKQFKLCVKWPLNAKIKLLLWR